MCGRFAQALPPRDYVDTVDEQVIRRRGAGGRPSWRRGGGESSVSSQDRGRSGDGQSSQGVEENDAAEAKIVSNVTDTDYHPTHNVAPGVRVPVVRLQTARPMAGHDDGGEEEKSKADNSTLLVQAMRWGLLPHYTTAIPRGADAMRTINARDDAVLSGRSMWTPILRAGKRCVVFSQGFYEWQKKDEGAQRIAHFVGMKDLGHGRTDVNGEQRALMPMAGLWEKCMIEGDAVFSFTVITTESNKQLGFLHDRMPVILPDRDAIQAWLGINPATNDEICALLKPYEAGLLDCYPVPREVGRVGTDDKSFILPVASRKDGIAAAFGRMQRTQTVSPQKGKKEEERRDEESVNSESNAPIGEEIKSVTAAEDEVKLKRGAKRRERSESIEDPDAALARKLQAEEDDKAKRQRKEQPQSDVGDGEKGGNKHSSRFSPEPYNPPVSPPRPKGGYSTVTNPDPSPYKRTMDKEGDDGGRRGPRAPGNAVKQRQLQESAKGTKDIRSFMKRG